MADTPWCGSSGDKLYLTSGQFTSTIKTSQSDPTGAGVVLVGVTWDGTNSPPRIVTGKHGSNQAR